MRKKIVRLRQLISEIDEYDEYRPVFFNPRQTIGAKTQCMVVLGDRPSLSDFSVVPASARLRGMVRFLSSGQIMDVEGTLSVLQDDYSEQQLYAAIAKYYEQYVKA